MTCRHQRTPAVQQERQEREDRCVTYNLSESLQPTSWLQEMKSSSPQRGQCSTKEISSKSAGSSTADSSRNWESQCISSSGFSPSGSNVRCIGVRSGSRSSNRECKAPEYNTPSASSTSGPLTLRDSCARRARRSNLWLKHTPTAPSPCSRTSSSREEQYEAGTKHSPAAAIEKLLQSQRLKRWLHYLILLLRSSYSSCAATPTASGGRTYFFPSWKSRLTWPAISRVTCCCICLLLGACCIVGVEYWCVSLYTLTKTLVSLDFPSAYEEPPPSKFVSSFGPVVYPPEAVEASSSASASDSLSVTEVISDVQEKFALASQKLRDRKEKDFSHVSAKQHHVRLPQNLLLLLQQPSSVGPSTQPQQQVQHVEHQLHSLESLRFPQARVRSSGERQVQRDDPEVQNQEEILQYIWQRDRVKSLGTQKQQYVVGAAVRRQLGRTVQVGPPDTYTGFRAEAVWDAFKEAPQDYFLALMFLVSTVLFCFFCSWLCQQRSYQKAILVSP